MLPSEIPRLITDSPVRVFPRVWKLLSFLRLPSQDGSLSLPLLSLFLSFIFFPTSFWRQWAAFLGAWCPLPAFRSCFVELLSIQMFFWWICGGESGLPVLFLHHLRTTSRLGYFESLEISNEFCDGFFCLWKHHHWDFDRDFIESVVFRDRDFMGNF